MKQLLIIALSGLLLSACHGDMGEKAAEGTTGDRAGVQPDTAGKSMQKRDSTKENKSNY